MIEYKRYVAETDSKGNDILEEWRWLVDERYELWFVTKGGDAFLKCSADGSIHWLSTIEGTLDRVADDQASFESGDFEAEDMKWWFKTELLEGQVALGQKLPKKNECLSLAVPVAMGGELVPDNIEVSMIPLHFDIAGQVLRQVKDLPEGTKISGIEVTGLPDDKPWWKFW